MLRAVQGTYPGVGRGRAGEVCLGREEIRTVSREREVSEPSPKARLRFGVHLYRPPLGDRIPLHTYPPGRVGLTGLQATGYIAHEVREEARAAGSEHLGQVPSDRGLGRLGGAE